MGEKGSVDKCVWLRLILDDIDSRFSVYQGLNGPLVCANTN